MSIASPECGQHRAQQQITVPLEASSEAYMAYFLHCCIYLHPQENPTSTGMQWEIGIASSLLILSGGALRTPMPT